jgi:hypothetical protein
MENSPMKHRGEQCEHLLRLSMDGRCISADILRQSADRNMAGFVTFVNDGGERKIESM